MHHDCHSWITNVKEVLPYIQKELEKLLRKRNRRGFIGGVSDGILEGLYIIHRPDDPAHFNTLSMWDYLDKLGELERRYWEHRHRLIK